MFPRRISKLQATCESLNKERFEILKEIMHYSGITHSETKFESLFSASMRLIWMKNKMIEKPIKKMPEDKIRWEILKAFQQKFKDYNPQHKITRLPLQNDERPFPDFIWVEVVAYYTGYCNIYFVRKRGESESLVSIDTRITQYSPQTSKCEKKIQLALETMIKRLVAENNMLKRRYNELRKETEHLWVALRVGK